MLSCYARQESEFAQLLSFEVAAVVLIVSALATSSGESDRILGLRMARVFGGEMLERCLKLMR